MYICIDFESITKPMYMTFDFREFQYVSNNPNFEFFNKAGNDPVKWDVEITNRDLPKELQGDRGGMITNVCFLKLPNDGVIENINAKCMDENYCYGVNFNGKQYIFDQQRLRNLNRKVVEIPSGLF